MDKIYIQELEDEFYNCVDTEDFEICEEYDGIYSIYQVFNGAVLGRFSTKCKAELILEFIKNYYNAGQEKIARDEELDLLSYTYNLVDEIASKFNCNLI